MTETEIQHLLDRAQNILLQGIHEEIQPHIDEHLNPLIEPLGQLQSEVDELTTRIEQAGENIRTALQEAITQRIESVQEAYVAPVEQGLSDVTGQLGAFAGDVNNAVDDLLEHVKQAQETLDDLFEPLDNLKQHFVDKIDAEQQAFSEQVTAVSDALLTELQQQLAALAAYVEHWIVRTTGMGDEKVHQALQQHTTELTAEMTETIRALLDELLAYFDAQLAAARRALLDAVNEGSASREAIDPMLQQLEVARQMIEALIERVRDLASTVGEDF